MTVEELKMDASVWGCGNEWEKENMDVIMEAFPDVPFGIVMSIYHFGYINGFERAQNTLEKTKHLFM